MDVDINFRNGFLLHGANEQEASAPASWIAHVLHDLRIKVHPDTHISIVNDETAQMALIGEAFDPENGLYSTREVIAAFKQRITHTANLLDLLDSLAGRFVLIAQIDGAWRVYHDAIGSRSVFYHTNRRVVASHIELIAESFRLRPADYFIPFITSRNYFFRDVKYLPGAMTPYKDIVQLTPNVSLSLEGMMTSRYWPRKPLVNHDDVNSATEALKAHIIGLSRYLSHNRLHPILGLTGGTDSRGIFAALRSHTPTLFSYVRSKDGNQESSKDTLAALRIANIYRQDLNIWALKTPSLNDAGDDIGRAFRRATSYYRGNTSAWLSRMADLNEDYAATAFIRGFGGEVLRGFYQTGNRAISKISAERLSHAYDVNAGSLITRRAFADFISSTAFTNERFLGRDPNDMFYLEHRMGTWGSSAMSEADLVVRSLVGYNSRNLFDKFMSLEFAHRTSRQSFHDLVKGFSPEMMGVDVV